MGDTRLLNYVECNPTVKLKKGEFYNLVDIDSITVGVKYSDNKGLVEYTGQSGSKFSKGDTIMARITPCLENGKIAMYNGDVDSIGSTELFVFRAIPNVSNKDFVYYFMKQNSVRNYAANSMTGASGRQRADIKFVKKMKCSFPSLETQNKIADILSTYDELIENNNKRIKLLEQMAENLYKEWFVRFRFPGYENAEFEDGIPADWEYVKLGEKLNFERGVGYSSADLMDADNVLLSMNNIRPWGGFIRDYSRKYSGKFKEFQVVKQNDLIMSITDMTQDRRIIGYVGLVPHSEQIRIICTHLMKVTSINSEYDNVFLYGLFNFSGLSRYISERATGANVLGLTANILNNVKWYFPTLDLIHKYCAVVKPLYEAIEQYEEQNENLIKQRDLLLPRLMSGKLEV